MARNDRAIRRANRNIQNIAKGISNNMDALYRSTYMSSPQQGRDLKDLGDRINDSLDKIVSRNMDSVGVPSITKLYMRASGEGDERSISNDLDKMFDNGLMTDDIYGMFMSNRYLKELDNEIDTVCKYMPSLEEALMVQKDCILSADHFSKTFLTLECPTSANSTLFSERTKDLLKAYGLPKLVEEIYEDTSKYGEKFIYRVPYKLAIGKLLATKPDQPLIAPTGRSSIKESYEEYDSMNESFLLSMDKDEFTITSTTSGRVMTEAFGARIKDSDEVATKISGSGILEGNESFKIGLEICRSCVLESAVRDHEIAEKNKTRFKNSSLASMHEAMISSGLTEANLDAKGNINYDMGGLVDKRTIANDGLVAGERPQPIKIDIPGCVVKKLERDKVLPIYIEDMCLGYYYFECRSMDTSEAFMGFKNILGDPLTNMRNGDSRTSYNTVDNQRQDDTIKYVAAQLSTFINKQFVMKNQDLAKEIYMILKFNDLFNTPSMDLIKVTFIPPEDIVHFNFKQDPITHRGISDLEKSLIPAKIYSSLYISSAIGQLTRGQDKRVYYVKQTVDTNIAQTLMNTINQIKQGNFGIRQFQNINNVLNITGRFNDYVIPTNASGDPPIQFEIMPGQDIQTPTELMDALKEMAIDCTGVPLEIVQARQSVDYAMQLTMSSSKFLRFCYKRQEAFETMLSNLITPIYNYQYNESLQIDVKLPPPVFLQVTNTNQLVDNTKNYVNSIVEVELADEQDDAKKAMYTKELFKFYISGHLDLKAHQDIQKRCGILSKVNAPESHSEDAGEDY